MAEAYRSATIFEISEHEDGRAAALRRFEGQSAIGIDRLAGSQSQFKTADGDLLAGGAGGGRSGQASRQNREGEGNWARSAQRKPQIRQGRSDRERDSLENPGPRLLDGV